jgi:LuxR family maltose regulon positive regulatory protein
MSTPILATKLYIPPPRPTLVLRPRLIERLNEALHHKLTLISAPAGFGKTTLLSEWINQEDERGGSIHPSSFILHPSKVAWFSLDKGDNDPARFLSYLVTALQTIAPHIGAWLLTALQSPQPPSAESLLTNLLNEIATIPDPFLFVLDDYHVIDAKAVDDALTFLLEHLPPQMRLVIATREDPNLPLARLRGRGQLAELRAADLRFTPAEAADFLNQVMGLSLSAGDIAALETRTEGWIAGLQLASLALQGYISMQGRQDATHFIKSFTGSHHFVMDYLVEEVLHQQPAHVQTFLLYTSILERLCGPLSDALLLASSGSGQATLEYLERANLFIIPLDNERRWYRYHHLFADLLRQRLHQSIAPNGGDAKALVNELHVRASQWFEDNDLDIEAFHHAAAANDIDRAERLMDGRGIPLHLRGAVTAITEWLESLPPAVMNARPSLWWRWGAMLLVIGQTTGVQEKLDAAEAALQGDEANHRYLIGRISVARAVLALTRYQPDVMLAQSRRALEHLPPTNLTLRANANWTMGVAHLYQGERAAAQQSLGEALALAQSAGDPFFIILATIGLGNVAEANNQLHLAAETYRRVLQWAGDQPLQIIYEAHLGLARILYEWNDLDGAEQYGRQSLHLAHQYDQVIDRFIVCELFLARVLLAQGDEAGAAALVTEAEQSTRQRNFVHRLPEIAAAQVTLLLRQGNLDTAEHLVQTYELPLHHARVHLAQGNPAAALALLAPLRQQFAARNWPDEQLKVMVLQALAHQAQGDPDTALRLLAETLALAEPAGFIRPFVDEGRPMADLLARLKEEGGRLKEYTQKLLAAFAQEEKIHPSSFLLPPSLDSLSQREREVLQLIAQGLSNQEISQRLFLALDTVKGHNRRIFDKLQVQRRTEAVARARELGLL